MASSGRNTNNNSPSQKYAYRDEQGNKNAPPYTYSSRKYRNNERSSERGSENTTHNSENYGSSRQNHDSGRQKHDSSRQNRDSSKHRDSSTKNSRQTRDSDRDSRAGSVRPVSSRHKEHIKQQYQKISEYSTKSIFNDVDLKLVVQLPQGEDKKEWVSTHTLDFYSAFKHSKLKSKRVKQEREGVSFPFLVFQKGFRRGSEWVTKGFRSPQNRIV